MRGLLGLLMLPICSLFSHETALFEELRALHETDQKARLALIASHWGQTEAEEVARVDQENVGRLKEIVDQYGWPGIQRVGEEGADRMWLLVQHCDRDLPFQKKCLVLLQEAVAGKDALPRHLAYLTDRTLVNEGLPQLYGTQFRLLGNEAVPYPIANEGELDARRAEMGLESFPAYTALIQQVYHIESEELITEKDDGAGKCRRSLR